jgi:hypothetical protein
LTTSIHSTNVGKRTRGKRFPTSEQRTVAHASPPSRVPAFFPDALRSHRREGHAHHRHRQARCPCKPHLLPSTSYQGSFYAKADNPGGLTVRLVNDNTGNIAASSTVTALSGSWQKYDFTLKTGDLAPCAANHLEFLALHPGTVRFQLISLFPPTYNQEPNNEEYHDSSGTYDARFAQFYKAIKQRYPQLQLIAAAPVTSVRPDILDDNDHTLHTHFYRTAQQFFVDTHRYDAHDRSGAKILRAPRAPWRETTHRARRGLTLPLGHARRYPG